MRQVGLGPTVLITVRYPVGPGPLHSTPVLHDGVSSMAVLKIAFSCGWKSVAMVVRYEHASEEREALLAQGP